MALESILKKVKGFAKPYFIGKLTGVTIGITIGVTFGDQVYDLVKEIPYYDFSNIKTYLITGYIGQDMGGKCGILYYLFKR